MTRRGGAGCGAAVEVARVEGEDVVELVYLVLPRAPQLALLVL